MSKNSCAEDLARDCVRARFELRRAAQVLHDDVGSLLAVAGLRLQLLRMDHPETDARAAEVSEALDGVMDHLRTLSRALEPSPVRRTGLKNALLDLAESCMESTGASITVRYTSTVILPPEIADALYHAIASAVASTPKTATRTALSVSGTRSLAARVCYDGPPKKAGRELAAAALLARHAGLEFAVKPFVVRTRKGTIVSIRYAIHRPSRG
jgi:signal transduction histidine kinase